MANQSLSWDLCRNSSGVAELVEQKPSILGVHLLQEVWVEQEGRAERWRAWVLQALIGVLQALVGLQADVPLNFAVL